MATNSFKIKKSLNLDPQAGSVVTAAVDVAYNNATAKLEVYNGAADPIVTEADTATLTNKSISGSANTLTNIPNSATTATNVNTASAIVARDPSGNFTAGTITAALSGNATTATNISGTVAIANGGTGQVTNSAAFDALSPMTTGGDIIYGGASGTGTRLANGSSGQFLKSNGTTVAPSWSSVTATPGAVQTQTTTYQILTSDYLILCSGSAFTATLPAATGSGITIVIQKTDVSLTNIITVKGSGTDNINGANTTTLNTQYEQITVVDISSGNWELVSRVYPSVFVQYTPTFVGWGTPSGVSFFSRRIGDSLEVQGYLTTGTTTGVAAGFTLGFGGTNNNVVSDPVKVAASQPLGMAWANIFASTYFGMVTLAPSTIGTSTINVGITTSTSSGFVTMLGNGFPNNILHSFYFRIPISGWNG